ncbi:MAG: M24 family metallopeptidase [Alphaproteobacteria bacterium]|nr:M24 family metallopeptidase [Alphaproteobacteria bacterium]
MFQKFLEERKIEGFLFSFSSDSLITPFEKRLFKVTGFTGSFGIALILKEEQILFTDARYLLQAPTETSFLVQDISKLKEKLSSLKKGMRIGFDASCHSVLGVETLKKLLKGKKLVPTENIADVLFGKEEILPYEIFDYSVSGQSVLEKIKTLSLFIKKEKGDFLIISNAANVAWLLNKRSKRAFTPVLFQTLLVSKEGEVYELSKDNFAGLKGKTLLYDKSELAFSLLLKGEAEGVHFKSIQTPILKMKAVKTPLECQKFQEISLTESRLLTQFLMEMKTESVEKKTECSVLERLMALRQKEASYLGESFPAISSVAEHSAVVHYIPTPLTDKPLSKNAIYLLDTGGHYFGGTTDVTRTVCLGQDASLFQKQIYTRVLKGHIALAKAEFDEKTSGAKLDGLARTSLNQIKLDYAHSTSHGIGNCLHVHEMPPVLSPNAKKQTLKEGMILSNEPGCYLEGKFGVRIENMMQVIRKENGKLGFLMLSLIPFDVDLIDFSLLSKEETDFLSAYNREIEAKVLPFIPQELKKELERHLFS